VGHKTLTQSIKNGSASNDTVPPRVCCVLLMMWTVNREISLLCVELMFNCALTLCAAVNGNVECARILLQTSQNDDRNAVNCVDKLERFEAV